MSVAADSPQSDLSLSRDDCFDLLSNHRRRYTLHYLKSNGETATLGELADQVAAWENDVSKPEVGYDERKRVYTSLQQVHLPRMEDMGVVHFDDREGTVELDSAAQNLDIYLEVVEENDIPWSLFYLVLGGVSALIMGGVAVGVPVLSSITYAQLSVFLVTTFLVTSIVHLYLTRTEMYLDELDEPPEVQE